jgi:hypothetical protein
MRRTTMLAGLVALMPMVMGAGGNNPTIGPNKLSGPTFIANVVLDPHEGSATTTAKRGFIRIAHGPNTAAATFKIPATGFGLGLGCDPTLTDARFLFTPLIQWIPEDTLNALFDKLEASRNTNFEPVVSDIVNEECTPDPANPTTGDSSAPGILSFQAEIKFLVPK